MLSLLFPMSIQQNPQAIESDVLILLRDPYWSDLFTTRSILYSLRFT